MKTHDIIGRDTDEAFIPNPLGIASAPDYDQIFALDPLPDNCVDAANRTRRDYGPGYPGWEIYCLAVRGDSLNNRMIEAWAVGMARSYSRTRRVSGHPVVAAKKRGPWIAQAGRDAIYAAIHGQYPASAYDRSMQFGMWHTGYQSFRDQLIALMLSGFNSYRGVLHYHYAKVVREAMYIT